MLDPAARDDPQRPTIRHWCEDGHYWTEQPDGGVSPSWGYGLTSIKYPGHDPKTCPEPERGHSIYDGHGPYHGYQCPTCLTVHYCGGCLRGVRTDPWNTPDPECAPPAPACGKPAVRSAEWKRVRRLLPVDGDPARTAMRWTQAWVPVRDGIAAEDGEQLALA